MQYPTDAVTLLVGCFRGFGRWGVCEIAYISGGKFLDTVVYLKTGMRELPVQSNRTGEPSQMRWAMCVAYYIPPQAWQHSSLMRWTTLGRKSGSSRLTSS